VKEIEGKAKSGSPIFKGLGEEDLPSLLDEFALVPSFSDMIGSEPDRDMELIIGKGRDVKTPLSLTHPFFIDTTHIGKINKSVRIALAYGAFLARCSIAIGYGLLPEEEKIAEKFNDSFILQWTPMRLNNEMDILSEAKALVISLERKSHKRMFSLDEFLEILDEKGELITAETFGPEFHLDFEKASDLEKHVELLKEATDYKIPVMVKVGTHDVHETTKAALSADSDAVIIDTSRDPYSTLFPITGNYGTTLIGAIPPAVKAFSAAKAKDKGIKLLISGGFRNGADILKAIALGADGICLTESATVALGCNLCGDCNDLQCERGMSTRDEGLKTRFKWKVAGKKLANFISATKLEMDVLLDYVGVDSVGDLSEKHIVALTYDSAAISGVKLVGYDRELPMWFH
jgi:hypothetical protein